MSPLFRRAAIDIGTNTALLLIADQSEDGNFSVIEEHERTPRLGKGVDENGTIREDRILELLSALKEYAEIVQHHHILVKDVIVCATSAMRDAANREEIIRRIASETGFQVRLLSGDQEAATTWAGALWNMDAQGDVLVVDIGGGSTELAIGKATESPSWAVSLNMGSVRATERYLHTPILIFGEVNDLRSELTRLFIGMKAPVIRGIRLIGVAGTATVAARIILQQYSGNIHGQIVTKAALETLIYTVSGMTAAERLQAWPELMAGRADIFPAGLIIMNAIMDWFNIAEIQVSAGGIRHGALLTTLV